MLNVSECMGSASADVLEHVWLEHVGKWPWLCHRLALPLVFVEGALCLVLQGDLLSLVCNTVNGEKLLINGAG